MKTLLLSNEKGGVGKSMIATQFAYYCADILKLKVLFIDNDSQGNGSATLCDDENNIVSEIYSINFFKTSAQDSVIKNQLSKELENNQNLRKLIAVRSKHNSLMGIVSEGDKHPEYTFNFLSNIDDLDDLFDICIIDTNPSPDIRLQTAMMASTDVLSVFMPTKYSLDGFANFLQTTQKIQKLQKENERPILNMLGLIGNQVSPVAASTTERTMLRAVYEKSKTSKSLIMTYDDESLVIIHKRPIYETAQAIGKPVWDLEKEYLDLEIKNKNTAKIEQLKKRVATNEITKVFKLIAKKTKLSN